MRPVMWLPVCPMDPLAPPSLKRRVLTRVVQLLVLAGVGLGGWKAWTSWRQQKDKPPEYQTEVVQKLPLLVERTTATGTLQALVTVSVGSQVSGRIAKLYADYNSQVKQGQLLAELDPTMFQTQVSQNKANVEQAKAQLARAEAASRAAERTLKRTKELYANKLATQADLDGALANSDLATADIHGQRAQLVQAEAQLALAETNLTYTKIFSPVDGVVLARSVDVGQTVAASMQAPVLFQIAKDLGQMQVHAAVDEADVGRLKEGMPAHFTVDAFRGEVFTGTVSQLRLSPTTVQNVVTYDAVVDVANPGNRLRPGMTATVTFDTATRRDVVVVPNAALRWRPGPEDKLDGDAVAGAEGKKWAGKRGHGDDAPKAAGLAGAGTESTDPFKAPPSKVYVLHGGLPKPVEVVTGVTDGRFSELLSPAPALDEALVVRRVDKDKSSGSAGAPSPFSPGGGRRPSGGGGGGGGSRRMF